MRIASSVAQIALPTCSATVLHSMVQDTSTRRRDTFFHIPFRGSELDSNCTGKPLIGSGSSELPIRSRGKWMTSVLGNGCPGGQGRTGRGLYDRASKQLGDTAIAPVVHVKFVRRQ